MPNTNCLEGLRCPQCKQDSRLHIAASVMVSVTDDGTEDMGNDYEWQDDSYTRCPECDYAATLKDFRIERQL